MKKILGDDLNKLIILIILGIGFIIAIFIGDSQLTYLLGGGLLAIISPMKIDNNNNDKTK